MELSGKLVEAKFLVRVNRFLVKVRIHDTVECFLPNPGRLEELLLPRARVILRETESRHRRTRYDLIGVRLNDEIVSIDSRIPNMLIKECLENRSLKEFSKYRKIIPEYKYGNSRFDFLLLNGQDCLIEVKSCTLVKEEVAMFPDAPTERGRRHVEELSKAREKGYRTSIIFVVQRSDAKKFKPNDNTDPTFGEALRKAFANGVEVYSYYTCFRGREINIEGRLEVDLK